MPTTGRGNSLSGDGSSLSDDTIASNPMFKIKLKSLETDYEQNANTQTKDSNKEVKFTIGDIVGGESLDGNGKSYNGKIISIHKNEFQKISYIEIIDKDGEKRKLNPKTCVVDNKNDGFVSNNGGDDDNKQRMSYSAESLKHIIEYDDFR